MNPLLDQITQQLSPQLAGSIADQFGLSADTAQQAVPAVAQPLLENLKQKAESPERNIGLLASMQQLLTDGSKPTDPAVASSASPGDSTGQIVEKLAGGGLGGLSNTVANTLGIESSTAQSVILFVAPKIFAMLRGRAQSDGFSAVLQPLVGENANVNRVLKLLEGAGGGLGSVSEKLGGMFGS